ncbi:unnamed protein product [Diamesa serratosioi]
MFEISDIQKIGVGLAGFGVAFLFLGILLIFDRGLLAIGNILFICGLACIIGLARTKNFFFQKHKAKGSVAFFGGIIIVLIGYPLIGMVVESYGFISLFAGFIPVTIQFIRRVPVLGNLLNLPFISTVADKLEGSSSRQRV